MLGVPAPARAPLGLPRLDRLVRKPDRQAATPAQALVVIAPVRDLALLLRDVAASVLVQLEGQGGHPGSDGGLPCYLDRAPGATRGIPATTWRGAPQGRGPPARPRWHPRRPGPGAAPHARECFALAAPRPAEAGQRPRRTNHHRRARRDVGHGRGAVIPTVEDGNIACLYLETTNRCNLLCTTCPRTYEQLEPPADMGWELFTSIVDQVPGLARAVLHGVGEPMLVENLPRM